VVKVLKAGKEKLGGNTVFRSPSLLLQKLPIKRDASSELKGYALAIMEGG
jgi:hypothetical protein